MLIILQKLPKVKGKILKNNIKNNKNIKILPIDKLRTNVLKYIQKDVIIMNKGNNIAPINENLNVEKQETNNIKNLIYTIRGRQVMLDSDIAQLYGVETKRINEAVKRNSMRFPERFCFQINEKEYSFLRSQFATASVKEKSKRNKSKLPYVFTEQGVAMLSCLLRNKVAVQVSINIMNAFVEMRKFISVNGQVFERLTNIEYKLLEHDSKFNQVFDELQKNKEEEFKQKVFFKGQIYDAYEVIIDLIKSAESKIILIDNYIDYSILKMLKKKNKRVEAIIITSNNCNITKLDIKKFNEQYPVLKIARTNKFHDRFILIDNKELYHCGASIKDLGKKCFGINKIEDLTIKESMEKQIKI